MQQTQRCSPPQGWKRKDGSIVSCTEKVKVLEENWAEIRASLQDALDDAVLMGCGIEEFKSQYRRLIDELSCSYREQNAPVVEPGRASASVEAKRNVRS